MKPSYVIKLLKMNYKYHKQQFNLFKRNKSVTVKNRTGFETHYEKEIMFHLKIMNELAVSIKHLQRGIK